MIARHAAGLIQVPGAALRQLVKERPPPAVACDDPAEASCGDRGGGLDEVSVLRTRHGPGEPDAISDDLLRMARHVVLSEQAASASLLQDRLQIDVDVAAHALAALEAEGTVGPVEADGGRNVLRAWATTNGVPDEPPPAHAAAPPTPLKQQPT
jgi:DNA segregation ATPase FtsK/SpoIIIE-like protein